MSEAPNPEARRTQWLVSYAAARKAKLWARFLSPSPRDVGILAFVAILLVFRVGGIEILALIVGAVVWAFLAVYQMERVDQSRTKDLAEFDDFDPFDERYFVDLTLTDGNAVAGKDLGVLWFEDGRMNFVGAACSFSLGSGDVEMRRYDPGSWVPKGSFVLPLCNKGYCGYRCVVIEEVPPPRSRPLLNIPLNQKIGSFTADPPVQFGELPPLGLGPGAKIPPRKSRVFVLAVTGFLACFTSAAYMFSEPNALASIVVPAILLIIAYRDDFDSLRDLRALRWHARQESKRPRPELP